MAPVIKDSIRLLSVNNSNFIHHMSMSTLFKMKMLTLNGRENRRGNQECTIKRYWQHLAHKAHDKYKQNNQQQQNARNTES